MLASLYSSSNSASSLSNSIAKSAGSAMDAAIWPILAIILGLVGGIVLYFTFLRKENDGKFKGFLGWMYDTLSFKKLLVETILKITYLILAIFITVSSLGMITTSFFGFLFMLVLGNLFLRIGYEFCLISIITCKNTTEMNSNLKKIVNAKNETQE